MTKIQTGRCLPIATWQTATCSSTLTRWRSRGSSTGMPLRLCLRTTNTRGRNCWRCSGMSCVPSVRSLEGMEVRGTRVSWRHGTSSSTWRGRPKGIATLVGRPSSQTPKEQLLPHVNEEHFLHGLLRHHRTCAAPLSRRSRRNSSIQIVTVSYAGALTC